MGRTLKGLLDPRRPGKHGAIMCTLQVQEQDLDDDKENTEAREQKQVIRRCSYQNTCS